MGPDTPSTTQSFGEMTGMMSAGESSVSLVRSGSELLMRGAQAAQREGMSSLAITIAECLTRLTEATTAAMTEQMTAQSPDMGAVPTFSGGGGIPSLQSPQTSLPTGPLSRPY